MCNPHIETLHSCSNTMHFKIMKNNKCVCVISKRSLVFNLNAKQAPGISSVFKQRGQYTPPLMYLVLQIVSELVFVGPMRISKTQHNFKTHSQHCFYYFQIYHVVSFNHHSVCFARIFQFYSILEK